MRHERDSLRSRGPCIPARPRRSRSAKGRPRNGRLRARERARNNKPIDRGKRDVEIISNCGATSHTLNRVLPEQISKHCKGKPTMGTVEAFRAASQIDLGTVLNGSRCGGSGRLRLTYLQWRHIQSVRQTENIFRVCNSDFLEKPSAHNAVQLLQELKVPALEPEAARYSATRGVHLSHINLIWRIRS